MKRVLSVICLCASVTYSPSAHSEDLSSYNDDLSNGFHQSEHPANSGAILSIDDIHAVLAETGLEDLVCTGIPVELKCGESRDVDIDESEFKNIIVSATVPNGSSVAQQTAALGTACYNLIMDQVGGRLKVVCNVDACPKDKPKCEPKWDWDSGNAPVAADFSITVTSVSASPDGTLSVSGKCTWDPDGDSADTKFYCTECGNGAGQERCAASFAG